MARAITEDPVMSPPAGNGEHTGPIQIPNVAALGKKGGKALPYLLVALLGSGGLVSTFYLTEARSKENATAIEEHEELPAHSGADKRIERIERDVADTKETVDDIRAEQTTISDGIDQLKQEAQTDKQRRTERELEELRRELRTERRRNRPR